ncbi:MAG: Crp/Fnr family transcriptional regulator [Acidimicrobiales bacterium]
MTVTDLLGEVPSNPVLSAADLRWFAPACEAGHLEPGDTVFSEGSRLDAVHVIVRGTIALSRERNGRRVTLLLLRDGSILGDTPLLTGMPSAYDAIARSSVDILSLPATQFLRALREAPSFALHWAMWTARRLASLQGRIGDLLAGDLQAQVASLLLHEIAGPEAVALTQQSIADLLGAQRTSISRVLSELARRGVIRVGYGHITVINRRALASAAVGTAERIKGTGA